MPNNQPLMQQLNQTASQTDDYLMRVGLINNQLMTNRESAAIEELIVDWLDELAITSEDLTKQPEPMHLLQMLHSEGISVPSRMTVSDFRELQREFELDSVGEMLFPADSVQVDPLHDVLTRRSTSTASPSGDAQLFALPELESRLKSWADKKLQTAGAPVENLTFQQACQVANLATYLLQAEAGEAWWVESLQLLRSSEFFKTAANPQPTN